MYADVDTVRSVDTQPIERLINASEHAIAELESIDQPDDSMRNLVDGISAKFWRYQAAWEDATGDQRLGAAKRLCYAGERILDCIGYVYNKTNAEDFEDVRLLLRERLLGGWSWVDREETRDE